MEDTKQFQLVLSIRSLILLKLISFSSSDSSFAMLSKLEFSYSLRKLKTLPLMKMSDGMNLNFLCWSSLSPSSIILIIAVELIPPENATKTRSPLRMALDLPIVDRNLCEQYSWRHWPQKTSFCCNKTNPAFVWHFLHLMKPFSLLIIIITSIKLLKFNLLANLFNRCKNLSYALPFNGCLSKLSHILIILNTLIYIILIYILILI